MAIIALKAWYLKEYEPIRQLEKRPHDLRLSKNSLLKSGLRADFLDDSDEVKQTEWFQRYLEGDSAEFYIEGSGSYTIANIDLTSHEIYFIKQDLLANLDPTIFLCYQTEFSEPSDLLREEMTDFLEKFNRRSRVFLTLEESNRLTDSPISLNSTLMRKLRKCLLFVADATPIVQVDGTPPQLFPSPKVCVEVGYALQCKRQEQILLAHLERGDIVGQFPFDLPNRHRLAFKTRSELRKLLIPALETGLQRFNLT